MSLETEVYKGYTINVEYDEDCAGDGPDTWGNFTITGGRENYDALIEMFDENGVMLPEYKAKFEAGLMFWVDKFEHGQVRYTLGGSSSRNSDHWDTSSNWGVIESTDDYAKNFDTYEGRKIMAEQDLDTYTDWANGAVYGYTITNQYGEDFDGSDLWGIYGLENALEEARMAVDADIKYDRPARHAKPASALHN